MAMRWPLLLVALLLCAGCSKSGPGLEATAICPSPIAELRFAPDGVEVRIGDHVVAQATSERRTIDFDACPRTRTQTNWFAPPGNYARITARTTAATTLVCRFRARFFVHVTPVYSSEGGEDFPDGSAIYLVVSKRRLVASATANSNRHARALYYVRKYCTPA
jgi:hypothetical protein